MQTTTQPSAYQRHILEQMRTPMPHVELHTLMRSTSERLCLKRSYVT